MPTITGTPVVIDPSAFSRQSRAEENPFLFQHNGLQYQLLVPGQVGVNGIGVFLSQDNGQTWTEVDAANSPDPTNARAPAAFYNASGGKLEIIYRNATGHAIVSFTLAGTSSAWGTPGTTLTDATSDQCFFARRHSDGTYVLFTENGAGTQIVYYTNTAGTWSSATNLISGSFSSSGMGIKGGALSSTDVAFFAYINNSNAVRAARVSAAFAVSTASLGNGVNTRYTVKVDEANDKIFVAWNGNQEIYVSVGTPLSAPTYAPKFIIFSEGGSSTCSYPTLGTDADGNTVVFFIQVDVGVDPVIDRLYLSTFDGVSAWSTPIVYFDAVTDPPPDGVPDPVNQFLHTGDVVLLSDGTFLFVTALETVNDGVDHCTGFALVNTPEPGCPTIYVARQPQPDAPAPLPPPGWPV